MKPELKKKRRLRDHFDPDLTHILVDRSFIMDTHIPGLSGRCFIIGRLLENAQVGISGPVAWSNTTL